MLELDLATPRGNAVKRLEYLGTAKQMADTGSDMAKIKLATGGERAVTANGVRNIYNTRPNYIKSQHKRTVYRSK